MIQTTTYAAPYDHFMENEWLAMNEIVRRYARYPSVSLPMGPFFDELKKKKCEVMRTTYQ